MDNPIPPVRRTRIRKSTLQKHWAFLKEQVDLKHIANELIESNVLTPEQWMSLKKHSNNERMNEFLYIIFQGKVQNYSLFVEALRKKGYDHVADVLEEKTKTDTKQLRSHLDIQRTMLSTSSSDSDKRRQNEVRNLIEREESTLEDANRRFMESMRENMQQLMTEQANVAREQMKAELQTHKREMMLEHKKNYDNFLSVLNDKQNTEKELGTLKIELKNLEGEKIKLEEERKRLMSRLADSERTEKESTARLKTITHELDELKKKHTESKTTMKTVDISMKRLEKEKADIKMKLENKEAENENFRTVLSKKQKQMKELETDRNGLVKQLDNAEQKRSELAKDIKKFELMMNNLDPSIRSKSLRQNSGTSVR